ncbi:MAG: site-specific recombinase [Gemmatimonadaceae bacterium]|nr:site-specific recombinase [Gemmatimonadaceae bacterium]
MSTIPAAPRVAPNRDLTEVLSEIARHPEQTTAEGLGRVIEALRHGRREAPEVAVERLRTLVELLGERPELAGGLAEHLRAVLLSRMHRTLYSESGILSSQGFLTGVWSRLIGRVLPPAVDPDFLRDLMSEVFDEPRDADWVAVVPADLWDALFECLGVGSAAWDGVRAHIRRELFEGMRILSHRIAALGVDPALLRYLPSLARQESPFLAQSDEVRLLIDRFAAAGAAAEYDGHLGVLLAQCTEIIARIRRRSHETGVGVNLVFVLARLEQQIARLRYLRALAIPRRAARASAPAMMSSGVGVMPAPLASPVAFLTHLVRFESRRPRIGTLFEGTTQLLARRVTEQASKSGEHYVTDTREEYREMFRAAAGAGLIVAVMALLKILAAKLGLPAFWEAVAYSLIYGLGFVIVHILHLTIATKQPAMTAATLAAAFESAGDRESRLEALASVAAKVSRTQWVSIAGNVIIGFLTAMFIALIGSTVFDWHPVTPEKGATLLHDLHPWKSLALVHAAIAGVYLFVSGLVSGYYDNQSLYHRVPERIRRVKWLRRVLGTRGLERVATYIEHNLGALAGNFLFGCMLGSTGTLGKIFGLPIDIRHVAFASANLAYGLQALDFQLTWQVMAVSAVGMILIGVVNLVVSFRLALTVALRSRGITAAETEGLTARVLRRFRQKPLEFLVPQT